MPKGLPAHLCRADGGFENLCRLLAINTTRQKQEIFKSPYVKKFLKGTVHKLAQTTKQSERLQKGLTMFYSDPDARRFLWQKRIAYGENPNSNFAPFPCLEYEALKVLDESLVNEEHDPSDVRENSEYYSLEAVNDEWRSVAVVALPRIEAEVKQWHDLSSSRKNRLLVAAFATSTILDDVRFLKWCIDHTKEAAQEFPFLNSSRVSRTRNSDINPPKNRKQKQTENSVLDRLTRAANCLGEAASQLTRNPLNEAKFDAVALHALEIAEMRKQALEFSEQTVIRGTLDSFVAFLSEKAQEYSWFSQHVDEIVTLWENPQTVKNAAEPVGLQGDIDQKKRKLTTYFCEWSEASAKEQAARIALNELLRTSIDSDSGTTRSNVEYEHHGQIVLYGKARLELEEKILDVLKPKTESHRKHQETQSQPDKTKHRSKKKKSDLTTHAIVDTSKGEPDRQPTTDLQTPSVVTERTVPTDRVEDVDTKPSVTTDSPENLAIWRTLKSGHLGIAYHIAVLNEVINKKSEQPSSDLLAILALGLKIEGPGHELVQNFGYRVGNVVASLDFNGMDLESKDAAYLLVLSASLRPALFAGQQEAIVLLKRLELSKSLTPVYSFANSMATHADRLRTVQLGGSLLGIFFDAEQWRIHWDEYVQSLTSWKDSRTPNFGYQPISRVWNHWTNAGGSLFELGEIISRQSGNGKDRVNEFLQELTQKSIKNLVRATWQNELKQTGQCGVSGRLLNQVERHLKEPIKLARQWLHLIDTKPKSAEGWTQTSIESLREDIRTHSETALAAISKCQESPIGLKLNAALHLASSAISSIEEILTSSGRLDKISLSAESEVLSSDLVYVKELVLNHEGEIDDSVSYADARKLLVEYPNGYAENLEEAFEIRLERQDLAGARAVHQCMKYCSYENESKFHEQLNVAFAERCQHLNRLLDELTEKLESSFIVGEVLEEKYSSLSRRIASARQEFETNEQDNILQAILLTNRTENELSTVVNECLQKLKEQFDRNKNRLNEDEWKLIKEALESEDLIALHEYIDCVNLNRPLASSHVEECRTFKSFLAFLDHVDQDPKLIGSELVRAFKRREDVPELRFSSFSEEQLKQFEALITPWFKLVKHQTLNEPALEEFLGQLGLKLIETVRQERNDESVVEVRTTPLQDRELCPVHSYGSEAEGKYEIILSWTQPAYSFVIQAVRTRANRHVLVLHFGHLSREDRQQLSNWSNKNAIKFIVIDETLVFFLASFTSGRLRALFDCTLPFTCVEPFFTAAGLMPSESFYGREQERRSILDRYGSCFVYGGRQLGKTALLRSAEAAFHEPQSHHIAICIDLKQHDVGPEFNPEIIWTVLTNHFVETGIISSHYTKTRQRERQVSVLKQHIKDWVSDEKNGRILLLLDEADDFLAADLKNEFRESETLKGMMDETDRKFKVVLCGLHNVLRNTERANHPLAHFGEPICVGPLLSEEEREQARALIREPLAAVGYVFENHGLMNHVLFRTNYYPSLIQIYGEHLVRHLRSSDTSSWPRDIVKKDLDTVFSTEGLGDYIKQRFALTLQLDQRYEVIAYSLALELRGDPSGPLKQFSIVEILELAREHWNEGFNVSINEFETLLREMCGLGVLRRDVSNNDSVVYAFRNPNVLLLLGNEETILEVLDRDRIRPDIFEAATYRAQYPNSKVPSYSRGPLTFEQENKLKKGGRIAVVCGTPLANLEKCKEFLNQRLDTDLFRELEPSANVAELRKKLTGMRPSRFSIVCMVNENDPYAKPWIDDTLTTLKRTKVGKLIRVVFLAGAEELWHLVVDLPLSNLCQSSSSPVDWIGIHSWSKPFLRQWCMDENLAGAHAQLEDFYEITGGWPRVLEVYAEFRENTWQEKRDKLLEYIKENVEQISVDLGLYSRDAIPQLKILRDFGALSFEEVSQYEELLMDDNDFEYSQGTLQRRLFWAQKLGLVFDQGGSLVFNPLVKRILAQDQ